MLFRSFLSIFFLNDGGCISLEKSDDIAFVIESCTFANCSSYGVGSAFFIYLINGSIVMNKLCGTYCYGRDFQFSYTRTNKNSIHMCNLVSLSHCPDEPKNRNFVIFMESGFQNIQYLNITRSLNYLGWGILSQLVSTFFLSISNFERNNSTSMGMLHIKTIGYCSVNYANFINNSMMSTLYGLIIKFFLLYFFGKLFTSRWWKSFL